MKINKYSILSASIAAALMSAAPAWAQDQEASPDERLEAAVLDRVAVTARRMEETAQDVPLPITAFTAEDIQQRGLRDINDIALLTPGFSFPSGFGRQLDRPIIRGMSNILGEANAAFFIDGVFVSGSISGFNLDNLERIEVIRGPQSALYGRRTFSGAVNFVTRQPGDQATGRFAGSLGADGFREVTGFWSGPIINEMLAIELNASHRNIDGRWFNETTGRKDIGGQRTDSIGTTLRFTPTDQLTARLRFNYLENEDQNPPMQRQGSALNNCFLPQLTGAVIPGAGFPIAMTRSRGYFCGKLRMPDSLGLNTEDYRLAGLHSGQKREAFRYSLALDYLMRNNWTISSTSAYNRTQFFQGIDADYSSARALGGAFETFVQSLTRDVSQEIRLTTDTSRDVTGVLGAYFYRESAGRGFSGSLAGFNLPPAFAQFPITRNPTDPEDRIENRAVFALVDWRISDQWSLSLEGRYAEDEIRTGGRQTVTLTVDGESRVFVNEFQSQETFSSFTPRITLSHRPQENILIYGLVAQGTKPGGFNSAVQDPSLTDQARADLIAQGLSSFNEETAWNYEFGLKSDWLDNRLRLNASVFYIDWTNQQLTESRPAPRVDGSQSIFGFLTNIGKSRVQGLELESVYRVTPSVTMSAGYAFVDTKIRRFDSQDQADLFGDPSAAGNRLPKVPKHNFNLGLAYEGFLPNGWSWFAIGDYSHESRRYVQVDNLNWFGPTDLVNLRLGLRIGDNWTLTGFVRNLLDDDSPEDVLRFVDPQAFIAVPRIAPLQGLDVTFLRDFAITAREPRLFGATLSYQF